MGRTFYAVRIESNRVAPELDGVEKKVDHLGQEKNGKNGKKKKSRVRIFFESAFRFGYYRASVILVAAGFVPSLTCKEPDVENANVPMKRFKNISKTLNLSFKIIGREKLSQFHGQSAVVTINHQDIIDMLVLGEVWPDIGKATAVCKKSLGYYPFFGTILRKCDMIFVDRTRGKESMAKIRKSIERYKSEGTKFVFFPEGACYHQRYRRELLPFKKGAFITAIEAQIPIIPVVFSHYDFLDTDKMIFEDGTITISVLDPVPTEGLTKDNAEDLSNQVRDQMLHVYKMEDNSTQDSDS